jgi:hypothetical protein
MGGHMVKIGESTRILDTGDLKDQRRSVVGVAKFQNEKPQNSMGEGPFRYFRYQELVGTEV